jgi:GTP cyclohydrolase I
MTIAPERDLLSAERAAEAFLSAVGVDLSAPGLAETPMRMASSSSSPAGPRCRNG